MTAWRFLRGQGIAARISRSAATAPAAISHHADQPAARGGRGAAGLRLACLALDRPDDVGRHARRPRTPIDPLIHKVYLEELAAAYARPPIDRRIR